MGEKGIRKKEKEVERVSKKKRERVELSERYSCRERETDKQSG